MKTSTYFWSYLAKFFLEREVFQTKVMKKIKTHFVYTIPPPTPEIVPFMR